MTPKSTPRAQTRAGQRQPPGVRPDEIAIESLAQEWGIVPRSLEPGYEWWMLSLNFPSASSHDAEERLRQIKAAIDAHARLARRCAALEGALRALVDYVEVYKTAGWSESDIRMVAARAALQETKA